MGEIFGFDSKWRLALHWTLASPALTRSALRVLLLLLQHCNPKTRRCDPSMDRLAKALGLSRRSVVNAINELRARGAIVVGNTGPRSSNQYNFPEPGDAHMPDASSVNPASSHGEARFQKYAKPPSHKKVKEDLKKRAPWLSRTVVGATGNNQPGTYHPPGSAEHRTSFEGSVKFQLRRETLSDTLLAEIDSSLPEEAYRAFCNGHASRATSIEAIVEACRQFARGRP